MNYYRLITDLCIVVGVICAFGHDKYPHPIWLVTASIAGVAVMGMYFRRHWERLQNGEK